MPQSNVIITGLGVVSSIGIGGEAYFQALLDKRSGITSLANRTDQGAQPHADQPLEGIWIGGPITDFDAKQYVRPRKALKVMCREIQTAFAASQLSIEQAGLEDVLPASPDGTIPPHAIGTVFGSEMFYGPPTEMEDAIRACLREDGTVDGAAFGGAAMKNVMPLWMLKYLPNMPACHVGIALNAHGPNNTLVLGDVSGPSALAEAAGCLQRGIADVMVCGASGTRINTTRINYRGDLPIPEVYDPLEKSSRPFDPNSQGVVGGEGAAAVVLEKAEHASARGATPIARLVASASRFVPSEAMKQPVRSDEAQPGLRASRRSIELAITAAMQQAGIANDELGLVVSHAMGDPVIDQCEREAIESTVGSVPTVATIAALGHCGAASGMIDLATAALALQTRCVPPTIQTETTARDVGLCQRAEDLQGNYVLCLSHTSNGNATAVILGSIH